MRRILLLTVAFTLSSFIQCVGDSPVTTPTSDAGSDATPTDGAADVAVTDAAADSGEPTPKGDLAWVKTYGTTRDGNGVTVDAKGNVYVVGAYIAASKAVPVGNFDLPITTSPDAYAVKLDPNGNPLWAKPYGGTSQDAFIDVAFDATGDIYAIGLTNSPSLTFKGTITSPTPANVWGFLVKLSGVDGSPLWEVPFVATSNVTSIVLAVGASKVYVGTTFFGTLDAGAGGMQVSKGSADFAVMEIDATSHAVGWVKQIGGPQAEAIHDLTVGPKGDIYFAAEFGGAITTTGLAGKTPTQVGTGYNALLAKLAPNGTATWAAAYGDGVNQKPTTGLGVAVDRTGTRVAFSGNFSGGVDFGLGALGSAGLQDGFLLSIDDNGPKTTWQKTFGGSGIDFGKRVAFDPWGNVIVAGYYESTDAKIDGTAFPAIPSTNDVGTYVCKVKVDGTLAWAKGAIPVASDAGPASGGPSPSGLSVSSTGRIFVAGKQFKSAADYGDGVVHTFLSPPSVGADDSFIGSWNP